MWNVDEDKNKHIITSKEKKRFDEAIMQLNMNTKSCHTALSLTMIRGQS